MGLAHTHAPTKVFRIETNAPAKPRWKHVMHRTYEGFLALAICTGGSVAVYFLIYEPIVRHFHH